MSYAALPSQQKIDIAASVRAAYTMVIDNARLAVDLAWLPFAILIGAAIVFSLFPKHEHEEELLTEYHTIDVASRDGDAVTSPSPA